MSPSDCSSARAIQIARGWLGTPFVEGASVRGAGADCAGFVCGVLAELGLDVCLTDDLESGLIANQGLFEIAPSGPTPAGAVLALARSPGGPPVHLAIATDVGSILHAHWSRGVVENSFGRWFSARLVSCLILKGL